jgi:hypothetical protein
MGRSRLVAVLHEESWNRPDDLGHSNREAILQQRSDTIVLQVNDDGVQIIASTVLSVTNLSLRPARASCQPELGGSAKAR